MKLIQFFIFSFFMLIVMQSNNCSGQTIFNRTYYFDTLGTGSARANTVIQTTDNGFLTAGTTKNALIMFIIKTNDQGDTLWTIVNDLGTGGGDIVYTAIENDGGDYIVGGLTADISVMNSDAFLIKIKPDGDTVWIRKIGLSNRSERCYNIKQTIDGGYVFCGIRYNTAGTDCDVYMVKTDSLGYPQWEKTFGGGNYDFGNSIELTSDGGYVILGSTYTFGTGVYNMYLIKTDSLGNMLWQKTYGGGMKDYGHSMTIGNDGNYLLAGGIQTATSSFHGYVLKTDTSGVVIWQKQYGNGLSYNEFTSVKETSGGGIVVSGNYEENSGIRIHPLGWLMKLNTLGDSVLSKTYNYFQNDSTDHYFYGMDLANDGGFAMCGMTIDLRYGANPTNQMWLVKTDSSGCDNSSCLLSVNSQEIFSQNNNVIIYPNPFSSSATIEIVTESKIKYDLILYDQWGRQMKKILNITEKKIIIERDNLNSGMYFYKAISSDNIIGTGKILIN